MAEYLFGDAKPAGEVTSFATAGTDLRVAKGAVGAPSSGPAFAA